MTQSRSALATVLRPSNSVPSVAAAAAVATTGALPAGYDWPDGIANADVVFEAAALDVHYGKHKALAGVNMRIARNQITALIGPSGCGKSTYLRCFNRMNDLIEGCRVDGDLIYHGVDLYGVDVSPVEVRRRVGMVFQKPVPFPRSIYDNVAYGLRIAGLRKGIDDRVEQALRRAALWDEVEDRLKKSALALSGGQQQRLCIARAIAVEPEVLLMDEPCSALDPIATARIEELMRELRETFTIVIVTHNMQQAARCSDRTAFFTTSVSSTSDLRTGALVEYDRTAKMFSNPDDERTEQYVTGRFG